jgi:hypothetical protein
MDQSQEHLAAPGSPVVASQDPGIGMIPLGRRHPQRASCQGAKLIITLRETFRVREREQLVDCRRAHWGAGGVSCRRGRRGRRAGAGRPIARRFISPQQSLQPARADGVGSLPCTAGSGQGEGAE